MKQYEIGLYYDGHYYIKNISDNSENEAIEKLKNKQWFNTAKEWKITHIRRITDV